MRTVSQCLVLLALAAAAAAAPGPVSTGVERVINNAIKSRVFPGAVVAYGTANSGIVGMGSFGNYTYGVRDAPATPGRNPPMTTSTRFDLASLSKVVGATSAAAQFYQRGELTLEEPVASPRLLGPGYAAQGKGSITVVELLTHSAGERHRLPAVRPAAPARPAARTA